MSDETLVNLAQAYADGHQEAYLDRRETAESAHLAGLRAVLAALSASDSPVRLVPRGEVTEEWGWPSTRAPSCSAAPSSASPSPTGPRS